MSIDQETQITLAVKHLKSGHCVAIPTETVYGLAGRIDSDEALKAIFQHKMRPSFDPLIVHISNLGQIPALVKDWPLSADSLARRFWPGALTLVVKKSDAVSPIISSGLDTVGLRLPSHPVARALIERTGVPLAAPSANRFGRTSPTTADHVRVEFPEAIKSGAIQVLDGGPCHLGVESTVCRVTEDEVSILRPGGVTEEEIRAHFKSSDVPALQNVRVTRDVGHHSSPGHTEHHYETQKPLLVVWHLGVLPSPWKTLGDSIEIEGQHFVRTKFREITLSENPTLAARELYSKLREADLDPTSDALVIQRVIDSEAPEDGLWAAIDDRLKRAARRTVGIELLASPKWPSRSR